MCGTTRGNIINEVLHKQLEKILKESQKICFKKLACLVVIDVYLDN